MERKKICIVFSCDICTERNHERLTCNKKDNFFNIVIFFVFLVVSKKLYYTLRFKFLGKKNYIYLYVKLHVQQCTIHITPYINKCVCVCVCKRLAPARRFFEKSNSPVIIQRLKTSAIHHGLEIAIAINYISFLKQNV